MYKTKSLGPCIFFLILTILFFAGSVFLFIEPIITHSVNADSVESVMGSMLAFIVMLNLCLSCAFRSDVEIKNDILTCTNLFDKKEIALLKSRVNASVIKGRYGSSSFYLTVGAETFTLAFTPENRALIVDILKRCKFTETDVSEIESQVTMWG